MQRIYLDNAATAFPKAPGVAKAVCDYIENSSVNINRASYAEAAAAELTVLGCREKLCRLFRFGARPVQAVFTPGATWGLNMLVNGILADGGHIIVSALEHNALMRPLERLARCGAEVSVIPADGCGHTDARDILPLFKNNTKLVLVNHASNVCGALFPLEETASLCRERGIPLAVDAAQTAGHMNMDFDALGLAALCVPGHKGLLGPEGIGALLLERDFARSLRPFVAGGTGSASDSFTQPKFLPDKFEPGTLNIPGIIGLDAALGYLLETGIDAVRAHEQQLTEGFIGALEGAAVRVIGPKDSAERVGVISLDFLDIDNARAAYLLEKDYGVLTRCGLHCAPMAHRTLGTFPNGTVRFSPGYANTPDDVLRAAEAVCEISHAG